MCLTVGNADRKSNVMGVVRSGCTEGSGKIRLEVGWKSGLVERPQATIPFPGKGGK